MSDTRTFPPVPTRTTADVPAACMQALVEGVREVSGAAQKAAEGLATVKTAASPEGREQA